MSVGKGAAPVSVLHGPDLADLLRTLPHDVGGAAEDLAERAARVVGTPVTVAARAAERWTVVAGPGPGPVAVPDDGAGPGLLVATDGCVTLSWDPQAPVKPMCRELLGQAAT